MNSFLDFVKDKKERSVEIEKLNEGFKGAKFGEVLNMVTSILRKNVSGKVMHYGGENGGFISTVAGDERVIHVWEIFDGHWVCKNLVAIAFNNVNGSNEVHSISIFDNDDLIWKGKSKAKSTLYTMGASLAYFLPLICNILNTGDYKLSDQSLKQYVKYAEDELSATDKKRVKESSEYRQYVIGAVTYHIFEASEDLKKFKKDVHSKLKDAYPNRKELGSTFKDLNTDYYAIVRAIKGGAENISDLDIEFKSNVVIELLKGEAEIEAERKLEEEKKKNQDPEIVFKKMRAYCKMVISGTQPSVILCGAPGVGKTFRVKELLRGNKYVEGQNLYTIKGKCTPRQLYIALYKYQKRGDIIVVDDADSVVGPKAPEDVINILKAALDSTSDDEGRLVSYGVSGKLEDEEGVPIPKRFYYNGGIIVITNYNAGQLDTALRGRSYIQDIHFSLDDILKIIKGLLPAIDENRISRAAKFKAYDYIEELAHKKGNEIEISIRTFQICARIFDAAALDPDLTEDECEEMISEQLQMQALRGGRKY